MQNFETSANLFSVESKKHYYFSFEKHSIFKTCCLTTWWSTAVGGFVEKTVLIWKSIIHLHINWQFRPFTFPKKRLKKKIGILKRFLQKQNWLLRIWQNKCWELLLGKPRLKIITTYTNLQFLTFSADQISVTKNHLHCLTFKYFFTSRKTSIDTLKD